MRLSRRLALIQRLAGLHSPDGQRHLAAFRLKSPANVHVPCSQVGGPGGVFVLTLRRGMIGKTPRSARAHFQLHERLG